MDIDLAALPDNVDALQQMVRTLAAERVGLVEAQAEIERRRERVISDNALLFANDIGA